MTDSKLRMESMDSPINFPEALERIGQDESFLVELLNLYFKDIFEQIHAIKQAIRQENFQLIEKLGHSLRGASANLSLGPLQKAFLDVETAGREKDLEKANRVLPLLGKEIKRLKCFLIKSRNLKMNT